MTRLMIQASSTMIRGNKIVWQDGCDRRRNGIAGGYWSSLSRCKCLPHVIRP